MRRFTKDDWMALFAVGYHCEVRGDKCVYRPAEWSTVHHAPACKACSDMPSSASEEDPPPLPSSHGHRYNFPKPTF